MVIDYFKIKPSKIFIVSPNTITTGGIELLHQLNSRLNCLGHKCFMVYLSGPKTISEAYKKYDLRVADRIEDKEDNIIVFPEIYVENALEIKHARVMIWWLSVDHFLKESYNILKLGEYLKWRPYFAFKFFIKRIVFTITGKKKFNFKTTNIEDIAKHNFLHAYQSEFARDYLVKHKFERLVKLSDYINKDFIPSEKDSMKKEPVVLYNPLKGIRFTRKLMKLLPEIKWKALENMTRAEVIANVRKSMLYIDFGEHPGKDRFPREAVINGCCIITGKKGAASFYDDIPIPDIYKIEQSNKNANIIAERIREILNNYSKHYESFNYYRERILKEEEEFYKDIDNIFC